MTNRVEVTRTTMFCSQLSQAVVLDQPERPRVFTRFENVFGSYTTAVRRLPCAARVISIHERSPLYNVYAFEHEDGTAAIHFAAPVRHLTESYGYFLDSSPLAEVAIDDELPAGALLQSWPCQDSDGNFAYGVNLRTVYMNLDGLTYEDGLVISESGAERISHTNVEHISVVLNANDLTLNLYGDDEHYAGFPEVGEEIKSGILLARRRINHESALFDLSSPQLVRVNWEGDTVVYSEGIIEEIDVFSNLDEEQLGRHVYNRQILEHHRRWLAFQAWVLETFGPYVLGENGKPYTEDVAYWYRRCRDTQSGGKWRYDRSEFDGVVIQFTVARRCPAMVGSKLTNRYGGKGVIAQIRPDAEMPTTEDGRHADLVVNSLGIVNRLNPAQLFESELNFIADHVQAGVRERCEQGQPNLGWEHIMRFLRIVNPVQATWMEEKVPGWPEREIHAAEVAAGEPIYIHQPPFFGTVSLEGLRDAYTAFGVERIRFQGIEERMIFGTNYYIKLRHEPTGKHSARSAKHLSVAGVPTKNAKGVRSRVEHHSTTPIRLGEQEIQGLLVANKPAELQRLLRLLATDEVSREGAIADLLLRPDPFSRERLRPHGTGVTRPVAGLRALLESIGLRLETEAEVPVLPTIGTEGEEEIAGDNKEA